MLALMLAVFVGGATHVAPEPTTTVSASACDEDGFPVDSVAACRAKNPGRCRDADVEVIGEIDSRPAPSEWPSNAYVAPPKSWPEYPTEKP